MKKFSISVLLLTAIVCGCNKAGRSDSSVTTSPSTAPVTAVAPVASFKITNTLNMDGVDGAAVKEGTPLAIENQSKNGDTYYWDFGNGNTSTEKTPSNMYLYPCMQTQTVSLKVTNANGVSTSSSQSFYVACYRSTGGRITGTMPANWTKH